MVPRWWTNSGAVMRYWNRRWMSSLTRISSGIGMPEPSTITRLVPSTVQSTMPGKPVVQPGGVAGERPHIGGRAVDSDLVADRSEH